MVDVNMSYRKPNKPLPPSNFSYVLVQPDNSLISLHKKMFKLYFRHMYFGYNSKLVASCLRIWYT